MDPIYKTTGPLDYEQDRVIYVERTELEDIFREIRRPYVESYLALLGPRQTGKTTLLFRVYRVLKQADEPVAFLDLSAYRVESLEQSYGHAALKVWEELTDMLDRPAKLRTVAATVDSPIRFREFLLQLARECRGARIVILLDEVGPFLSSLGFFETLRSISASGGRESEQAFKKYLFVFAGTVDLHELTTGQNSPLANVCTSIYLDGFGSSGTQQLVNQLGQLAPVAEDVPDYVHHQARGHPYLTQRICALIERDLCACGEERPKQVTRQHVERALDRMQEGDENLRYMILQLERYPLAGDLLRQMMMKGLSVPFTLIDPRVARLFVMGAIRKETSLQKVNGAPRERSRCVVCNPIYETTLRTYFETRPRNSATLDALIQESKWGQDLHPLFCVPVSKAGTAVASELATSVAAPVLPPALAPRQYLDFHIRIHPRPVLGEPFPLSVDSWAGMGTGQVALDVQDPAFWEQIGRLEQNELSPGDLHAFGTVLWKALFSSPDIARRYQTCQVETGTDKGLRIKLEIEPSALASLPWEYLYDPDSQTFPALSPRTPITRYTHPRQQDPVPLEFELPLRILLVSAAPVGEVPLDIENEQAQIVQAMSHLQQAGKVCIEPLEHATVRGLQSMLRRPFHVLHYIGHGVYDDEADCGMLALEDEAGELHAVAAAQLHYLLRDTTVRLGVFNACMTARGPIGRSVAGELMRAGLSAALAMEFAISDSSATAFAGELYRTLADGWPVDAAVAEGRKAMMFATGLEAMDWGIPVLFMRTRDGMLFRRPP